MLLKSALIWTSFDLFTFNKVYILITKPKWSLRNKHKTDTITKALLTMSDIWVHCCYVITRFVPMKPVRRSGLEVCRCCGGAIVPATTREVLCGRDMLASAWMRPLSQRPWGTQFNDLYFFAKNNTRTGSIWSSRINIRIWFIDMNMGRNGQILLYCTRSHPL